MLTRRGTLRIQDYESEGRHTWLLTGRLSRATALAFESMVVLLCERGAAGLALDLRELTRVDSAGLRAISLARELCGQRGCEFSLISLSTGSLSGPPPAPAGGLALFGRRTVPRTPRGTA